VSQTVATVVGNVRTLCRDRGVNDPALGTFEIKYHIKAEVEKLFQELGLAPEWETGVVTLVPGTYEYTIAGSGGLVNQIVTVRTHNRNRPLTRITDDELESMRRGPSTTIGLPEFICLREKQDQGIFVRLWPIPSEADTLDWLRARYPTSLTADTDSIPLSEPALRVLEKRVACTLLSILPDSETQGNLIDRNAVISKWSAEDANSIRLERIRINSLKRTGRVGRYGA
jgi:hypothetical protein